MKKLLYWASLIILTLGVAACGGGGGSSGGAPGGGITYGGTTSPATVDADNSDDLAIAATGGASQAIGSETAPTMRGTAASSALVDLSVQMSKLLSANNRTANQLVDGVCSSGTVDVTFNSDYTEMTIVYNNCTISGGYTADGTVYYNENSDGSFIYRYINFVLVYMGETYVLNTTVECDASYNCTYLTDYSGPDGRTYRVEGANVTSTGSNSYTVTATVYDPDYGYFTIDADVTYSGCSGGVPSSGTITYTGGGETATAVFNDCDSFTVTYNGVATTYYWADIFS